MQNSTESLASPAFAVAMTVSFGRAFLKKQTSSHPFLVGIDIYGKNQENISTTSNNTGVTRQEILDGWHRW